VTIVGEHLGLDPLPSDPTTRPDWRGRTEDPPPERRSRTPTSLARRDHL